MRTSNLPTFRDTITVLNRLRAEQGDIWYKYVVHGCAWARKAVKDTVGTTAQFANYTLCRIPENPNFKPYEQWKDNTQGFTLSLGDYLIQGEITEMPTAETILEIVHKYKGIEIQNYSINTVVGIKHYRAEGA